MTTIEDLFEQSYLAIKNAKGKYRFEIIPSETDAKISNLIKLFIQASVAERLAFYERVRSPLYGLFLNFAERSATLAVRDRSPQWVLEGLVALLLENCRSGDYRDTIVCMAPIYDAAVKIDIEADRLFEEVASYLENEAASHIKSFPKRFPYQKSLEAFNYIEVETPNGFSYEYKPWPK